MNLFLEVHRHAVAGHVSYGGLLMVLAFGLALCGVFAWMDRDAK
jgi:hypothetical protein